MTKIAEIGIYIYMWIRIQNLEYILNTNSETGIHINITNSETEIDMNKEIA